MIRRHEVGAVHFDPFEIGEAGNQIRHVPARSLLLDRNRNRVAIVFDQKDDWQILQACGVHRFPELAFAGCAFAAAHQRNLVRFRVQIAIRLRASHGLHILRSRRRRSGDNMELSMCKPWDAHTEFHIVSGSSPTGTQYVQAVGCAQAYRYLDPKSDEVTLVCSGEGATSEGEFWEAMNAA